MISIQQIRQANRRWFGGNNQKFFGDLSYKALQAKSGMTYLVRSTYAWSDMFGQKRKLHFRLNPIDAETLEIKPLINNVFSSINAVKQWLTEN